MSLLEKVAGRRILVIGDPCLDEYRYGPVGAIAKEAPVSCLAENKRDYAPGQAANVAANTAALGGSVTHLGILGDDPPGARLSSILREAGVGFDGVVSPDRPTTDRLKLVATDPDTQHVFHSYREENSPLNREDKVLLLDRARAHLPRADAVILSDYMGGTVFTEMVDLVRESGRPWVGDTRSPLETLRDAHSLKPNEREVRLWARGAGIEGADFDEVCDTCRRKLALRWLCLTRGSRGLTLFHEAGFERIAALCPSHLVRDHTGAGDTVTAVLGLALAAGLSPAESAELASWAAADVVAQSGTSLPRIPR